MWMIAVHSRQNLVDKEFCIVFLKKKKKNAIKCFKVQSSVWFVFFKKNVSLVSSFQYHSFHINQPSYLLAKAEAISFDSLL